MQCYLSVSTYRKQGKVSLPRAYKRCCCCCSCWNHHCHCFAGSQAPTDTTRVQESTVPLKLVLPRLLKLPVTCDDCCCSTPAVPLLQSAVLMARSPKFCAAEAAEAPLLRLLVVKAEGRKKSL